MDVEKHFPDGAKHLLTVSGKDLAQKLGITMLESVVCDVLNGVNIRWDSLMAVMAGKIGCWHCVFPSWVWFVDRSAERW